MYDLETEKKKPNERYVALKEKKMGEQALINKQMKEKKTGSHY